MESREASPKVSNKKEDKKKKVIFHQMHLVPRFSENPKNNSIEFDLEELARKKSTPSILRQATEDFFRFTTVHHGTQPKANNRAQIFYNQLYLEINSRLFEYSPQFQNDIFDIMGALWISRYRGNKLPEWKYNLLMCFADEVANRRDTNEALVLLYLMFNRQMPTAKIIDLLFIENEKNWNVGMMLAARDDQANNIPAFLRLLEELAKYDVDKIYRLLLKESLEDFHRHSIKVTLPTLIMMSIHSENRMHYINFLAALEKRGISKEQIQALHDVSVKFFDTSFINAFKQAEPDIIFLMLMKGYLRPEICEAIVSRKKEIFAHIYRFPIEEKREALRLALEDPEHILFQLLHKARYMTSTKETKGTWKEAKAEYAAIIAEDEKNMEKEEPEKGSASGVSALPPPLLPPVQQSSSGFTLWPFRRQPVVPPVNIQPDHPPRSEEDNIFTL